MDRLLLSMWYKFLGDMKKLAAKKAKIKYYGLCTNLNVCRKYQVKTISLNHKLGQNKIKLTSINFYLSVQCLMEPFTLLHMCGRNKPWF